MILVDRQVLRVAIDRGARTKDQSFDLGGLHGLQQADGALNIGDVVIDGLGNRFANRLETGKGITASITWVLSVSVSRTVSRTSPSTSFMGLTGDLLPPLRDIKAGCCKKCRTAHRDARVR